MASLDTDDQEPLQTGTSTAAHHSKRFRFKRKHRSTNEDLMTEQRRRKHSHRSHRSKRQKPTLESIDDPSAYDDSIPGLPPDSVFRESLFDAMGDDEGAAFWEGVYGQPIHNYPNTYRNEQTGELEQMDDDEYAQYVRRKMWEKSWEGIEAAKEEQRKQREQEKQRVRDDRPRSHAAPEENDYLFGINVERSLRRGERRRDKKRWKALWHQYLKQWEQLVAIRDAHKPEENEQQTFLRNKIAWPVESGKRKDVEAEQIERFINSCAEALDSDEDALAIILKTERVRWHPDKIQQRYGFMGIDDFTMQGVTAVFQVLDHMWIRHREKMS